MQQWGVIPANVGIVTWIYPIKFTSVYSLVTTRYAAYFDSLTQYSDKEMALCYINVDKCRINRGNETTERIYVIAIGQAQQWGCNAKGNREVVFPIGFSNITYSFAYSLNYGSGAIAWDEVLPSAQADITSATYRTENKQKVGPRVGNWIVIGF